MLGKRHEIARLQSDFYREKYRKILRWLLVSLLIIFVLIAAVAYLIFFRQPQQFYANTSEGEILTMPQSK